MQPGRSGSLCDATEADHAMSFNLAIMLRESRNAAPQKKFLRFPDGSLDYAEVDTLSGQFAAGLRRRGWRPGDKVAVQLANVPEFVVAYFGILKAGLTMVPLNPLLKAAEIAYHVEDSDARVIIAHAHLADEVNAALKDASRVTPVAVGDAAAASGWIAFEALLDAPDDGDIWPTSADDTAVLLYTSGTTGRPKGAELSHFQLYMNCTLAAERFGLDEHDVVLAVLPFFHVYGLSSVLNSAVRHARCVSALPRFDVAAVLSAIERDRITILAGVPTMYHALAAADTTTPRATTPAACVSRVLVVPRFPSRCCARSRRSTAFPSLRAMAFPNRRPQRR
jgi:long-chain acyl-CoA synthetase